MKETLPVRKKNRLKYYDYTTEGMYFITICTKNKIEILGKIINNNIELSKEGKIAKKYIEQIEEVYEKTYIDEYIIMPNHIHLIINIKTQANLYIPRIIKQYKMSVSKDLGCSVWQKSYHDHIIRNEKDYYMIKKYIQNNAINWKQDKYF